MTSSDRQHHRGSDRAASEAPVAGNPRSIVVLAAIAALVAALVAPIVVRGADDEWAWATVPSDGGGYSFFGSQAKSSAGFRIPGGVDKNGKGRYTVYFIWDARFVPARGHVQVTPRAKGPVICTTGSWDAAPTRLEIKIACFGRTGARKNARFSVSFFEANDVARDFAYLWADKPTTAYYVTNAVYSYKRLRRRHIDRAPRHGPLRRPAPEPARRWQRPGERLRLRPGRLPGRPTDAGRLRRARRRRLSRPVRRAGRHPASTSSTCAASA